MNKLIPLFLFLGTTLLFAGGEQIEFCPACGPESEYIVYPDEGLTLNFCAKWDPDFAFRGGRCCGKIPWKYRRRRIRCNPARAKRSFCDEQTQEQMNYIRSVKTGKIKDILAHLLIESGKRGPQAYCKVNQGFLAWGRPIVSTEENRLIVRREHRCVHFGTDRMVGMLEWVGREISKTYFSVSEKGIKLLVGDISAPRGGCLFGRGGRRGHASHMTGQDVDIGFLHANKDRKSPLSFSRKFDPEANWWLIKKFFQNPFACIKVIFIDRRLKRRLKRVAQSDPLWPKVSRYLRHVRSHRNHMHVRIGDRVGEPGCGTPVDIEYEERFFEDLRKELLKEGNELEEEEFDQD
ncbi:MAG: hypothetical protein CL678_04780 [Bdellovibrionaceae bacterium]|nr:hypothetical protein [Pseudobdellovibrionaceae bacterium]